MTKTRSARPADDRQVVGDQQDRHAQAPLLAPQQLQDAGLHGHVEGGGRLVGDEQVRLVGQGHGDHHALPLPSRQLVGPGRQHALRLGQAHLVEQLQHPAAGLAAVQAPGARAGSRRPAAPPCAAGSARSSAPERSWRRGRRGPRAAGRRGLPAIPRRAGGSSRPGDGPSGRAAARARRGRSPTCRSRTRPRGPRSRPRRCRGWRRARRRHRAGRPRRGRRRGDRRRRGGSCRLRRPPRVEGVAHRLGR